MSFIHFLKKYGRFLLALAYTCLRFVPTSLKQIPVNTKEIPNSPLLATVLAHWAIAGWLGDGVNGRLLGQGKPRGSDESWRLLDRSTMFPSGSFRGEGHEGSQDYRGTS